MAARGWGRGNTESTVEGYAVQFCKMKKDEYVWRFVTWEGEYAGHYWTVHLKAGTNKNVVFKHN